MKKMIAALALATLSTGAFASEATHNGQHIRDVAVKAEQVNSTGFGTSQGFAPNSVNTPSVSVVGADRGANSGQ